MAALAPHIVLRLDALQTQLAGAPRGSRGELVDGAAADLGVSAGTVHRWLQQHMPARALRARERAEQRKRRSDAGERAVTDDDLQSISAALLASYRKTGRRILTFDDAVAMLHANGMLSTQLSAGRLSTILAERGMHPAQLTRPTPAVEQRSLHPNHVWQVDASVCVAYYLSNATGLQVMDAERFNKNKPANMTRIQHERLIRYTVADHCSHAVLTRYYLGSECALHLADFLIWSFGPKDVHPMHGVPFIVMMDRGSASTSASVLNLLDRLQVRVVVHERHNSRANGSVEKAHDLIETHFESALRFQRVADLADLNAKALLWSAQFGARRVHTRHGMPRHEAWMRIKPHELRLAPPVELMRTLPTTHPEERRVDNNLRITYAQRGRGTRQYDLRYLPGVMPGAKVQVVINGLLAPAVDVRYHHPETGAAAWLTVQPVERDEMGFRTDAPTIGEELRQGARSIVDARRESALQLAFGGADEAAAKLAAEHGALAFCGRVDPFKRAAEDILPAYMPRRGTPLQVQGRDVAAPRISTVAAAKAVLEALRRIGRADCWGPHVRELLVQRWGDAGVPDDALDALVAELTGAPASAAPAAAEPARAVPLRAVGAAQ